MIQINETRWKKVQALALHSGAGKTLKTMCVMQAVDYITSGGKSDHPECACPALTSYAIRLNDRVDDETRQLLKPLIPKLVGTRDGKTKERAHILVHHSITQTLPILVDARGLTADAARLREFKMGEWAEMRAFCIELRPRLRAAYAADAYAYAADAAAAYAAAAYAADAYAYAYAAYAAAYAADAYAAYAADAAADDKARWQAVRRRIFESAISGLAKACELKEST